MKLNLFIALLFGCAVMVMSLQLSQRIINGHNADVNRHPWIVAMHAKTSKWWHITRSQHHLIYCGASIIDESWIVTAAHCFSKTKGEQTNKMMDPSYWHASIGRNYIKPTLMHRLEGLWNRFRNTVLNSKLQQHYYHFSDIVIHPDYNPGLLENDIALVRLKERLPLAIGSNVDSVRLPIAFQLGDYWPKTGTHCKVVGWGCTKANDGMSFRAHYINVTVQSPWECKRYYENKIQLKENQEFCAGSYMENKGICMGDSGSGLVCNHGGRNVLAGIASATHINRPESFPGIFIRISHYSHWIVNTMESMQRKRKGNFLEFFHWNVVKRLLPMLPFSTS